MAAFIHTMLKQGPPYGSGTEALPFARGANRCTREIGFFVRRVSMGCFFNIENGNSKVLLSVLTSLLLK